MKYKTNIWQPPKLNPADLGGGGLTLIKSSGAGLYAEFDAASDDAAFSSTALKNNGLNYDGSDLTLHLFYQLTTTPNVGDFIQMQMAYSLVSQDQNAITKVSTFTEDMPLTGLLAGVFYRYDFTNVLTGVPNAILFQLDALRNSTGGGQDNYNGNMAAFYFEIRRS